MSAHEYTRNHSSINRLLFSIILLTSIVAIITDNVNLMNGYKVSTSFLNGSSRKLNCSIYKSCTQCTGATHGCSWLIEKQICLDTIQSLSGNFTVYTKDLCPEFAVTYNNNHLVQVTVSNIAEKTIKNFFNVSPINISCEIENLTYNASIDNGVITCNWVHKETIPTEERRTTKTNPLFIFYFSIVVNNVRLQFNDPRDHYISYHGWTCPKENCTIRFWESDSKKYYCKWCLKNDGCKITAEQLNSCDIRNMTNNEKLKNGTPLSTIEMKYLDVAIESFEPNVSLFYRNTPTTVNITVRDLHWILANGRIMTVTIVGQSCNDPTTSDGHTVNCIIRSDNVVSEGPVVIEYSWMASVERLESAQKFRFVEPKFTGVSPSCGPATGGTRIKLTGEYLNVTTDVQVFFRNIKTKVMCDIVELAHDHIICEISANPSDKHKSGPLQIVFENSIGKYYKKKNVHIRQRANRSGLSSIGGRQSVVGILIYAETTS
ncbi:plexin-A3 [Acyrthosiphon pisum]|uniref:IPT/TIG domain-containing protein n=1 Tax=Acyrthosiphon pisum TaxID=7029 RepID=A0A8R2NMX9_ACYPI|nr:plexin-A3 [Acyrthosiphon pisum]XP_008182991.1 plexin-A3 [Acyrthosiphon pisum]XP_029343758.1 plexin-A3 [Acyrthosiphon pisum]|eukprot:XP_008182990.1 PREDICTED: plexin-A3 [Acyrthosiphon pisum]